MQPLVKEFGLYRQNHEDYELDSSQSTYLLIDL